ADLKRVVVIRSPRPQLVPFKLHRFGQQRQAIDLYSQAKKISRSSVISMLLNATTPYLNTINDLVKQAHEIEANLHHAFQMQYRSDIRLDPDIKPMMIEQHLYSIWHHVIKDQREILSRDIHDHHRSVPTMGKTEAKNLTTLLKNIIYKFNVKKAMYIYTDRRVDNQHLKAGGISNIILLKQTTFDGYLFDADQTAILPIFDLIIFGIAETLKKHGVKIPQSCVCWIPIYHTNNCAIMMPILNEGDVTQSSKNACNTIIINPFSQKENK
ncbi:hypothetical protein ACE1BM_23530, partial [Aeromonas jandaei]